MVSLHLDFKKDRIEFTFHDNKFYVTISFLYKDLKRNSSLVSFLGLLVSKVETAYATVEDLTHQREEVKNERTS